MKRLPFGLDLSVGGMPSSVVLVPENDAERAELRQSLEDAGVSNSLGFSKGGVVGCLQLPDKLTSESDGAIPVTIIANQQEAIPAWFWLVEIDDGNGRRFPWWSTEREIATAASWV
jgi:hypothetical protein